MASQTAIDELISGLTTKADKIRVLAKTGYKRTDIAKILDIRYQHVRQVLERSGFKGGLRESVDAEREPIEVPAKPVYRKDTSCDVLIKAGFVRLGEWTEDPLSLIRLEAKAPKEPGVYAFTVDDIVVYVGLTATSLKGRLDQYRRGHKGQRTSSRIKKHIAEALRDSKKVEALVVVIPENSIWHELPVNTAAGLEAGLIEMISPIWNIRVVPQFEMAGYGGKSRDMAG